MTCSAQPLGGAVNRQARSVRNAGPASERGVAEKGAPIARRSLSGPSLLNRYFMIRESDPGNAHVVTSRRSALILLANSVGALGMDAVTC